MNLINNFRDWLTSLRSLKFSFNVAKMVNNKKALYLKEVLYIFYVK